MTVADGHEAILDEAAAYLLDELDSVQRRSIDAHLARCPDCRAEYARLREALDALASDAPPVAPPPALRQRILDAARAAKAPPLPTATRAPKWRTAWIPAVAIAAAAVFALQFARAQANLQAAQVAYRTLAAQNRILRAQLAGTRADLRLAVLQLAATGQAQSSASAELAFARTGDAGVVVLIAHGLAAPTGTEVYQLWYLPAHGAPVSGGTLQYQAGTARLQAHVSAHLQFAGAAVSREPRPGDTQPEGPIVLAST